MKVNKKDIQKWINALRSGKYPQGRGTLESVDNKFCCLGVACKLFIPKDKILYPELISGMVGLMPDAQPNAPPWLMEINSNFFQLTGHNLYSLNDGKIHPSGTGYINRYTFDEIADLLQAVYIEEVLSA